MKDISNIEPPVGPIKLNHIKIDYNRDNTEVNRLKSVAAAVSGVSNARRVGAYNLHSFIRPRPHRAIVALSTPPLNRALPLFFNRLSLIKRV